MANIANASTTTKSFEEKPKEEVKEVKKTKTNDDMKCGKCGKELDKFSAANGIRFCNDECLNEFFA